MHISCKKKKKLRKLYCKNWINLWRSKNFSTNSSSEHPFSNKSSLCRFMSTTTACSIINITKGLWKTKWWKENISPSSENRCTSVTKAHKCSFSNPPVPPYCSQMNKEKKIHCYFSFYTFCLQFRKIISFLKLADIKCLYYLNIWGHSVFYYKRN